MKMETIRVTVPERDTIVAALRAWEVLLTGGEVSVDALKLIASDSGRMLDAAAVSRLADRIIHAD